MLITLNQQGRRIGESHPRAKLTDREAELIAWLHHDQGMSYSCLAEKFEVSKSCIAHICSGYRRGQAIGLLRDDPDAKP